jgi:hypothetical protein
MTASARPRSRPATLRTADETDRLRPSIAPDALRSSNHREMRMKVHLVGLQFAGLSGAVLLLVAASHDAPPLSAARHGAGQRAAASTMPDQAADRILALTFDDLPVTAGTCDLERVREVTACDARIPPRLTSDQV